MGVEGKGGVCRNYPSICVSVCVCWCVCFSVCSVVLDQISVCIVLFFGIDIPFFRYLYSFFSV